MKLKIVLFFIACVGLSVELQAPRSPADREMRRKVVDNLPEWQIKWAVQTAAWLKAEELRRKQIS